MKESSEFARKELLDRIISFYKSQNYIMEGKATIINNLEQFYEGDKTLSQRNKR